MTSLGVPAGARSTAISGIARTFEREMEAGRGPLWVPVLIAIGVLAYSWLPVEPPALWLHVAAGAGLAAATIAARGAGWAYRLAVVAAAVAAGASLAKLRTDAVWAPSLAAEQTLRLTGWVEGVAGSGQSGSRLVIRVGTVEGLAPDDTPKRVRVSVRGSRDFAVGDGVSLLAGLQPRPGPVLPGGYDFGRDLYYAGIGASGFAYGTPAKIDLGPPPWSIRLAMPVERLRRAIGARIEAALPGENGRLANALITGERGGIADETNDALRISGLAHILSISGLHMALVAGTTFVVLRAALALFPGLALRRPIKKWAAAGALAVATFYLLISGGGVATDRSYIMLAVMLVAVLLDRRAFSVRNVALAATIVLIASPESLLTASLQMSFAATLALVAGFEALAARRQVALPSPAGSFGRWMGRWTMTAVATSLLAGLATAPFGAFHFQRTAPLTLLANLAASPAISLLVMPFALLAVLAMPFGLEAGPLRVMDIGLDAVLAIGRSVAAWTGDAGNVRKAPVLSLLLASGGLVWLCLWRTRWRLAGVPVIAAGALVATLATRPDVIVAADGKAAAVRAVDGRYRIVGKAGDFDTSIWLRADADGRSADDPSLRDEVTCDRLGCTATIPGLDGRLAVSADRASMIEDCRIAAVVVTGDAAPAGCSTPFLVIDRAALSAGGAIALHVEAATAEGRSGRPRIRVETALPAVRRPWMQPLPPQ